MRRGRRRCPTRRWQRGRSVAYEAPGRGSEGASAGRMRRRGRSKRGRSAVGARGVSRVDTDAPPGDVLSERRVGQAASGRKGLRRGQRRWEEERATRARRQTRCGRPVLQGWAKASEPDRCGADEDNAGAQAMRASLAMRRAEAWREGGDGGQRGVEGSTSRRKWCAYGRV